MPTEMPTVSILESSGLPTELPNELLNVSVYGSSGQSTRQISQVQPIGSTLHCPFNCTCMCSLLEIVDCSLDSPWSCPLFLDMEVMGNLICMVNFPSTAHGQQSG